MYITACELKHTLLSSVSFVIDYFCVECVFTEDFCLFVCLFVCIFVSLDPTVIFSQFFGGGGMPFDTVDFGSAFGGSSFGGSGTGGRRRRGQGGNAFTFNFGF